MSTVTVCQMRDYPETSAMLDEKQAGDLNRCQRCVSNYLKYWQCDRSKRDEAPYRVV